MGPGVVEEEAELVPHPLGRHVGQLAGGAPGEIDRVPVRRETVQAHHQAGEAEHAQGIAGEAPGGGGAQDADLQVVQAAEGVEDLAGAGVEGDGIHREVAPREILVESGAGPVPEVHRDPFGHQPVGGEILAAQEDQAGWERSGQRLGDLQPPLRHHGVNVVDRHLQDPVAHHAAHEVTRDVAARGGQGPHDRVVEKSAEVLGGHFRMVH